MLALSSHLAIRSAEHDQWQLMKPNTGESVVEVARFVFVFSVHTVVYNNGCLCILLTSSSIRRRGTMIFCVFDLKETDKSLAMKLSRKGLEEETDHYDAVKKILRKHKSHPNVIGLLKYIVSSDLG